MVSVLRVTCGFALAIATGVPLGLAVGASRTMRRLLGPTLAGATAISPIAWIPVAIIAFGMASPATVLYGPDAWQHGLLDQLRFAVVAVVWYGGFFPIVLNTAAGVDDVRAAHLEAITVLGGGRRARLTKVVWPSAAPSIVTGLRLGAGIAWRVIIAAEIFPGTRSGIGYTIAVATTMGEYRYVFAGVAIIAGIGIALDAALAMLARRVGGWRALQR
jgi:NitT/TauT family transport system permease protein